jgi:hypothetical protein
MITGLSILEKPQGSFLMGIKPYLPTYSPPVAGCIFK